MVVKKKYIHICMLKIEILTSNKNKRKDPYHLFHDIISSEYRAIHTLALYDNVLHDSFQLVAIILKMFSNQ